MRENGLKLSAPNKYAILFTHLLVHLVDVLEVVVARLLQPLERLVEKQLEVLERILGERVASQPRARFAVQ